MIIEKGYSPGINDSHLAEVCKKAVENVSFARLPEKPVEVSMGGEDFFELSDNYRIPVNMMWLGIRNEEKGIVLGVHTSKFNVDEEALKVGMAVMLESLRLLQEEMQ